MSKDEGEETRGTRDAGGMSEMGKENDARRWKSARGGDADGWKTDGGYCGRAVI